LRTWKAYFGRVTSLKHGADIAARDSRRITLVIAELLPPTHTWAIKLRKEVTSSTLHDERRTNRGPKPE
jgi:hypothetical protein